MSHARVPWEERNKERVGDATKTLVSLLPLCSRMRGWRFLHVGVDGLWPAPLTWISRHLFSDVYVPLTQNPTTHQIRGWWRRFPAVFLTFLFFFLALLCVFYIIYIILFGFL